MQRGKKDDIVRFDSRVDLLTASDSGGGGRGEKKKKTGDLHPPAPSSIKRHAVGREENELIDFNNESGKREKEGGPEKKSRRVSLL